MGVVALTGATSGKVVAICDSMEVSFWQKHHPEKVGGAHQHLLVLVGLSEFATHGQAFGFATGGRVRLFISLYGCY